MKDILIGKQFKRNRYGLSIWTDTITDIKCSLVIRGPVSEYKGYKYPKIYVKGDNHWFELEEIVIITELNKFDMFQLKKEEFTKKAQEEWINRQQYKTE